MSLYDRARLDSARILSSEQGFTVPVVFISPTGVEYNARAFYIAPSLDVDMATGLSRVSPRIGITISLYGADGELVFTSENPADTAGVWRFTLTDNAGRTKTYIARDPMPDRTFGTITMTGKELTTVDAAAVV